MIKPSFSDIEGNHQWWVRHERRDVRNDGNEQRESTVFNQAIKPYKWAQWSISLNAEGEPALPSSSVMRRFPWMEFRHRLPSRLLLPKLNCTFQGMGWSWSWTWRRFRSLTALSSYKQPISEKVKVLFLALPPIFPRNYSNRTEAI